MELNNNKTLLVQVLDLFLLSDYNGANTDLECLLTRITEMTKKSATDDCYEIFQNWITKALATWEDRQKLSEPVIMFILKLIGIISKQEPHLQYWQNIYNKVYTVLQTNKDDLSPSIKMAHITMLLNVITHQSGRKWIIKSGIWKNIINYAHLNHTMYIVRDSRQILTTLLLHEYKNTRVCKEIILTIAAPLMSVPLNVQDFSLLQKKYFEQNKSLYSTLDLLLNILENTMFLSLENSVPELIERFVKLEMRIQMLFQVCTSIEFLEFLRKLLLLSLFLKLKHGIKKGSLSSVMVKVSNDIHDISMMLLSKKHTIEMLKNENCVMIYWKKLVEIEECTFLKSETVEFEHRAVFMMILPLCVYMRENNLNRDYFDNFSKNVRKNMHVINMQSIFCKVKNTIKKDSNSLEHICKMSIDLFVRTSDIVHRNGVVIMFQALCYTLKSHFPYVQKQQSGADSCDEDTSDYNSDTNTISSPNMKSRYYKRNEDVQYKSIQLNGGLFKHSNVMTAVLDGLITIIKKFKIKWKECEEKICLLSLVLEILNYEISTTMCTKVLKLCNIIIRNFVPPLIWKNLDYTNQIACVFLKRLHDPNWEVSDSVLEVLNTIAILTPYKYSTFHKFLLSNKFPKLALNIIKTNNMNYMRATALIFITSMVRVDRLWEQQLQKLNLNNIAIYLINNESEAIVRREAVNLLTELYIYRKWPKVVIKSMLQTMSVAAIFDLHWEVKINALIFWHYLINLHLINQGIIDDSFLHKLSSNDTKIKDQVRENEILKEIEIKQRLNETLDKLAKKKCLGVLLLALQDEYDLEVCRKSAVIIGELKSYLLKYNLHESVLIYQPVVKNVTIDTFKESSSVSLSITEEETRSALHMEIAHEEMDKNDTNLANISNNSSTVDKKSARKKTLDYISSVTRQDFLYKIFNRDIDAYIEAKDYWVKTYTTSFNSILEDILAMHKNNDINLMECY